MKPLPEILYRYRSLSKSNTCDIFLKNELYFLHPDQLNDPFDCKLFPNFEDLTKEEINRYFEAIDYKKHADKGIDLNKAKQTIENKSIIELKAIFKDVFNGLRNVGVLSLSEKNLDILMWGHYADSHKGICIGFDYDKLFFYFEGTPLPPAKVTYPPNNEYPKLNPFSDDIKDIIRKIFFTKALSWKYEQEWRVILLKEGRSSQKYDPDALVSVNLGCQISIENKDTVINWCLQRNRKPKIYDTKVDESSYSLKEYEITY